MAGLTEEIVGGPEQVLALLEFADGELISLQIDDVEKHTNQRLFL